MGNKTIGVVIGKFQTPYLHEGHTCLFQEVQHNHETRVCLVGTSEAIGTTRYPLPFSVVKEMILKEFPFWTVLPLHDNPSDKYWSRQVDCILKEIFPHGKFIIYGGRGCFQKHYSGSHPVKLISEVPEVSATDLRKAIVPKPETSFREGMIYFSRIQYPRLFMTVDIACLKEGKILLGQKIGRDKWQLPGGFVDPTDENLELAAKREFMEECDISIEGPLSYVGSFKIDDSRYRGTKDAMMTALFCGDYTFGSSYKASDDLKAIRFFPLNKSIFEKVVKTHHPLIKALLERKTP